MENILLNCFGLHHSQSLSIHKPMGLLAQDSIGREKLTSVGGTTTDLGGEEGELLPMNSRLRTCYQPGPSL